MSNKSVMRLALAAIGIFGVGCFQPPAMQPPPESGRRAIIEVPYDLTWDAVHQIVKKNNFTVQADDPDHGIVEAQAISFTLADADCGRVGGVAGHYEEEPEPGATAVYNFKVTPHGRDASAVSVTATFTSPLHVPLRPTRDFRCVSRGTAEKRLLAEVAAEARGEHRPGVGKFLFPQAAALPPAKLGEPPRLTGASQLPEPSELAQPPELAAPPPVLTPGRPTLLRPKLTEPAIH
jgi:hypothetical protein